MCLQPVRACVNSTDDRRSSSAFWEDSTLGDALKMDQEWSAVGLPGGLCGHSEGRWWSGSSSPWMASQHLLCARYFSVNKQAKVPILKSWPFSEGETEGKHNIHRRICWEIFIMCLQWYFRILPWEDLASLLVGELWIWDWAQTLENWLRLRKRVSVWFFYCSDLQQFLLAEFQLLVIQMKPNSSWLPIHLAPMIY